MRLDYKSFAQETLPDVLTLVQSRFGEGGCRMVRHVLRNPIFKEVGGSAGDIAYRDGRPVCFMATMVRRAYLGHDSVLCSVGGLFCKAERGCPLSATIEIMQRSGGARYGCSFGFGNTSSDAAWGVNKTMGGRLGPKTWYRSRYCVIHPLGVVLGAIRRKILHRPPPVWRSEDVKELDDAVFYRSMNGIEVIRVNGIEQKAFDGFWNKYLLANSGFVVSRSYDELNWMFGSRISEGRCVLLCAFSHGEMCGWMMIAPFKKSPRRWAIFDWLALNNDKETLTALLNAAVRFLKTKTNAWMFETRGFPEWSDRILKRTMPFVIRHKSNPYFFFPQDNDVSNRICDVLEKEESWFFGLYDGDACLCM